MSATAHITTMGRGIGITACAGIGPRAIGPGVTIIASGFPVTTRLGIIGITGIDNRFRIPLDDTAIDKSRGTFVQPASLFMVACSSMAM